MKNLLKVLCLVLCFVMLMALAACTGGSSNDGNKTDETKSEETKLEETKAEEPKEEDKKPEPATAMELWNLVDKKMEEVGSYEGDGTMEMVIYTGGYKLETNANVVIVQIGKEEDDNYYFYEFTKAEMSCAELSMKSVMNTIKAYNEGYVYTSEITDGEGNSFCSKMTGVEFSEYFGGSITDDFDFGDCTKAEFTKNDDGTWTLSFSGYTKKAVGIFLDDMDMDDGEMGADVLDMKIIMTANADFYATELVLEFVFDVEETDTAIPVLKQVIKYKNFDAATKITDGIKKDEYVEVPDVRVLSKVEDALDELAAMAEGSFTLDVKQELKDRFDTVTYIEKDTISFGKINGGYYYIADCVANGENMSVTYRNGVQTITYGGETQNFSQSEEDARAYVEGVMNSADYLSSGVSNIEKVSDGVYKLTVGAPSTTAYEEYLAAYGITFKSATQEIIVTFEGDELKSMESEVKVLAEYTLEGAIEGVDMSVYTLLTINKVNKTEQNF